jgi:hypothetical protein
MGVESVLVELDSELVDHDVNALNNIGFVHVFDQFLSVLEELDESSDFPDDSLLIFVKPFQFGNVFQENHDFSMFGHDEFVSQVRGDVLGSLVHLG